MAFLWTEDPGNPLSLTILNENDSLASVSFPENVPPGEYYFDLFTFTSEGDTVKSRTFVTADSSGIKPFDIKNDYAAWIDSAIIYQITPYSFAINGKFPNITAKIPEIAELCVTTIWLQPVYSTFRRGQGYDIIDYFSVRSDLGTEEQLRELIHTSKSYGLKVIFDFVPNHSSIGIKDIAGNIKPEEFSLGQNYPNPFNPVTNFKFRIPRQGRSGSDFGLVTLKLYDILGNEVAVLVNEQKPAGSYKVTFNAEGLASGVYIYQLKTDKFIDTKKLILLK